MNRRWSHRIEVTSEGLALWIEIVNLDQRVTGCVTHA